MSFVAGEPRKSETTFRAIDAASMGKISPLFHEATRQDLADACEAASNAQGIFGVTGAHERAAFLRCIADKIEVIGGPLIERAMVESGLPQARLEGERGRTVGQLRMFADEVEAGRWQRVRIDHADPSRTPPKPDLRMRMIPVGPVAVFGASNFPLAFSVAGGDTASALAAGCCVVVKGHPAHPGTSELVASAINEAISECRLPAGTFSLLQGASFDLGEALVKHPSIAAVGFTGSRAGGLALMRHAASREVPVPVYAEMSSTNPVVLLAHRLEEAAEALAEAYVGSLSLGAGQFCTNPGLVLALESSALDRFTEAAAVHLERTPAQTMLTPGIGDAFRTSSEALMTRGDARLVGMGETRESCCGTAQVFSVSANDFLSDPMLGEENFGPSSIIVRCADLAQLERVLEGLEGQLTTSIHLTEADQEAAQRLLPILERKAGRIIANGWPTGVEVAHAMVHGGPYPATSDGRTTSVGTLAMERFLRPVSYQDLPSGLLPDVAQENAIGLVRLINGEISF